MNLDSPDPLTQLRAREPQPAPRVLEALRREMQADCAAKRSVAGSTKILLSVAVVACAVALLAFKAWASQPARVVVTSLSLSAAAGAVFACGALPHVGRWDLSARRALVLIAALSVLIALGLEATHFLPWTRFAAVEAGPAASCAAHAFFNGILCLGALLLLWKKTDPFSPGLTGALLGLVGGLGGALSVGMVCPREEGFHLVLGHGLAALAVCGMGFSAGRKWMTP